MRDVSTDPTNPAAFVYYRAKPYSETTQIPMNVLSQLLGDEAIEESLRVYVHITHAARKPLRDIQFDFLASKPLTYELCPYGLENTRQSLDNPINSSLARSAQAASLARSLSEGRYKDSELKDGRV